MLSDSQFLNPYFYFILLLSLQYLGISIDDDKGLSLRGGNQPNPFFFFLSFSLLLFSLVSFCMPSECAKTSDKLEKSTAGINCASY